MDIYKIDDTISVAPQITLDDLPALAQAGFGAIICNRPDHEDPGQPSFADIENAARDVGLKAFHLPVTAPTLTDQAGDAMRAALVDLPGPVLAYCRSGMRSTALWALSQRHIQPVATILAKARGAGFDLGGLAPRLG